jgi:hypothetical protein
VDRAGMYLVLTWDLSRSKTNPPWQFTSVTFEQNIPNASLSFKHPVCATSHLVASYGVGEPQRQPRHSAY